MPFENASNSPRRIAVIGGGVSGLAAAYLLKDSHRVTLYEAEPRLGGHARTVIAGKRRDQPVDTGFIVFNRVNYPNLTGLFDALDVPVTESDMSFGASIGGGRLEYALHSVKTIFAQKRNVVNPRFLRMVRDIVHFNKHARTTVREGMSIGELLGGLGTGSWFREYYLLPFSGAIWSTPTRGILDFPAKSLVQFFENHALLDYEGQHQWYTVKGGSVEYVRRVQAALAHAGVELRTGAPVAAVRRDGGTVQVETRADAPEIFDEVIFATHSDVTLSLLADPSEQERRALGAVRYQPNHAVLHADTSVMPRRKSCWASWVYSEPEDGPTDRIGLSYWMNSLQPIPKDDPMFVTLNGSQPLDPRLIYDEVSFAHPVYDLGAVQAQQDIRRFNGAQSTWFCGAWMRNGFHEDGFATARDVVEAIAARDSAPLAAQ
ncbi:FAD-dependent oxidoreductase [Maribius pontilimi]|uniref:FAD-dependent oxidoreductase n=1 Tax=Palleronia pontilimi TaxID=1964209 RepID=A0A934MIC2_9RHOB|nr:FAD-dependent oxidoreductase [Palleronia pontilimi]MBJ3764119.1 FAD-dependent oxidoreductase [Palleronia pontilimi]